MTHFALSFLALSTACADKDVTSTDDTSVEADADTDADSDTDTDSDADTDTYPVYETTVDASGDTDWVYLDLNTRAVLDVADPSTNQDWDMAFRRYTILVNGGISGPGGVTAAGFETHWANFDEHTQCVPHDMVTDEADTNGDGLPEYAFGTWYDYDFSTHEVSPADVLYFVRTQSGVCHRLRFTGYYDDAGTSGHVSFESGPIDG